MILCWTIVFCFQAVHDIGLSGGMDANIDPDAYEKAKSMYYVTTHIVPQNLVGHIAFCLLFPHST